MSLVRLITQDKINETESLTIQAADGGNPPCTTNLQISIRYTDSKTIRYIIRRLSNVLNFDLSAPVL